MLQQAIFIVRGFQKNTEDFAEFTKRFAALDSACTNTDISYSVLYATPDTDKPIINSKLPDSVMHVEKPETAPFWTIGLNVPIQEMLQVKHRSDTTAIIPFSFETLVDANNAALIGKTVSAQERFIACRITPEWLTGGNSYPLASEEDVLKQWEYVRECVYTNNLAEILMDEKLLQTLCMFGRNTLAHYELSDFSTHGLFDETTDVLGGMEDWEYVLRLAKASPVDEKIFDRVIFYRDVRIKEDEGDTEIIQKQHDKLQREIGALKKIIERKL